jgi:hypothetical protein
MGKHIRKLFSVEQVKEVFQRYLAGQIGVDHGSALLKVRRRQFFKLLKLYRQGPERFSMDYTRNKPARTIDAKADAKIIKELKNEAKIIRDQRNPVRFYNYSYVKEVLEQKHKVQVSLPTIIKRAKKMAITNPGLRARPMTARC